MISALAWIPRGAARLDPQFVEIGENDEEAIKAASDLRDVEELVDMDLSTSDEDEDEITKAKQFAAIMKQNAREGTTGVGGHTHEAKLADSLAELDMDAYDDEEDDEGMNRILGAGNPGMAYYADPEKDPYLQKSGKGGSETDSDVEDLRLKESDLLIMAARNEEDVSHLEVWVYEEGDEANPEPNIYVRHAILLPAFPLCVAWGQCDPGTGQVNGNFAAVGSFEPGIEIWDLNVIDSVEPVATLGGADYEATKKNESTKNRQSKKKKKGKALPAVVVKSGSHEDAVLSVSWNQQFTNVLASGSADKSVKIWDIVSQQVKQTLSIHSGKVQSVKWCTSDASVLLTGGFDKNVFMTDVRDTDEKSPLNWKVPSDVEAMAWDPHTPHVFAVSAEDGSVSIFDSRKGSDSDPVQLLRAHTKPATSLSYCPCESGVLATGSTDATVKLWKQNQDSTYIEHGSQNMNVGAIFSLEFSRDSPRLIAAGGANGSITVWDTSS